MARKKIKPPTPKTRAPEPEPAALLVPTFPAGTHCGEAAAALGIARLECPRRPTMRLPFCWLVDGAEHWLVYSCSATDGSESQHQAMIAVMRRGVENRRLMVLLFGRNEPNPFDRGHCGYNLYHELFTAQGSVARHDPRFKTFWEDRAFVYRDFRVPGPEEQPDSELTPLVAANRCFLLPPTKAYDFEDNRSIHYAGYHPGEKRDPMAPWREPINAEDAAAQKLKEQRALDRAERAQAQLAAVQARERKQAEQAAKEAARAAKAAEKARAKPAPAAPKPKKVAPKSESAALLKKLGYRK